MLHYLGLLGVKQSQKSVIMSDNHHWVFISNSVHCFVFSGDFGDRYFGTDGSDGWSEEEDQDQPSYWHKHLCEPLCDRNNKNYLKTSVIVCPLLQAKTSKNNLLYSLFVYCTWYFVLLCNRWIWVGPHAWRVSGKRSLWDRGKAVPLPFR